MTDSRPEYTGQLFLRLLPPLEGDEMSGDMKGLEGAVVRPGDKTEVEFREDEQVLKPMRELDEIHKIFDALGVAEGFAADRLAKWFAHRVLANRANGHQDSCQCQLCGEDRIVRRVFRELRKDGP